MARDRISPARRIRPLCLLGAAESKGLGDARAVRLRGPLRRAGRLWLSLEQAVDEGQQTATSLPKESSQCPLAEAPEAPR